MPKVNYDQTILEEIRQGFLNYYASINCDPPTDDVLEEMCTNDYRRMIAGGFIVGEDS